MVILHWQNGEYDDYGRFSRWTAIPLYYWIKCHKSINNLNEETRLFHKPTGISIAEDVLMRFFRLYRKAKIRVGSAKLRSLIDRAMRRYNTDIKFLRNDLRRLTWENDDYTGYVKAEWNPEWEVYEFTAGQKRIAKHKRKEMISKEEFRRLKEENEIEDAKWFEELISLDELCEKTKNLISREDILHYTVHLWGMPHYDIGNEEPAFKLGEALAWIRRNLYQRRAGEDLPLNYLRLKYLTPPVQYDEPPEELQDIPNLTQIPAGTPTGVYFLCQGKKIVYVGQSNSPCARISQHQKDKIFDHAYMIPTDQPLALEDYYINKFKPMYNKTIKKEYHGNAGK